MAFTGVYETLPPSSAESLTAAKSTPTSVGTGRSSKFEMCHGNEIQADRKFQPCDVINRRMFSHMVGTCTICGAYKLNCCEHDNTDKVCHNTRFMFTAGACINDGHPNARAGCGVMWGERELKWDKWSFPIWEVIDPGRSRSENRANVLAAYWGLVQIYDNIRYDSLEPSRLIIATDSGYLVNGYTEQLPGWQAENNRTPFWNRPRNFDIFDALDRKVRQVERDCGVKIGFWHIRESFNENAKALARQAAPLGHVTTVV